jgi:putative flippase GtrA
MGRPLRSLTGKTRVPAWRPKAPLFVSFGGNRMEPAAGVVESRSARPGARHDHEGRRRGARAEAAGPSAPYEVEVVVPAYNEAPNLEASVTRLRRYLDESFPFRTVVTVVDNGSTDGTALVAQRLASTIDGVQVLILARKGRGYALRTAWSASEAEVVAYMDVDLSTSLPALLPLVGSVLSGHSDLAVGTRLARGSRVVRGPKRELISRAYSHMVRLSLRSRVSDFQCGFKAIRRERALQILPLVDDDEWFFDTELIVTAERLGVRISETPVEWTDDPASSVDIVRTALDDLHGIWRVARRRRPGHRRAVSPTSANGSQASAEQLLSFAGVGVLSTLSYLLLFAAAWSALGPWLANATALALCTLVNTALHRSLARRSPADAVGVAGRPSFVTVVAVLYGVSLLAATGAIAVAQALAGSSLVGDALATSLACCVAALLRFSLLRGWAFRPSPALRGPATTR